VGAIYLVRHGQASFGAADYDALSELGVRQSTRLGEVLRARLPAPAFVLCGRMRRHRQTAEACLAALGADVPVELDGGWDEYDHQELFGVLDPRFREQRALGEEVARSDDPARAFQDIFARAVGRWVGGANDGDYRETWSAFCARVDGALAALARRLGKSEGALVFTSGGPIARACGRLLGVPAESQLPLAWTLANAGVSKLITRGEMLSLSTLNEHAHFEGEARALLTYR
jgi:broad specificity phosphatase PhoE